MIPAAGVAEVRSRLRAAPSRVFAAFADAGTGEPVADAVAGGAPQGAAARFPSRRRLPLRLRRARAGDDVRQRRVSRRSSRRRRSCSRGTSSRLTSTPAFDSEVSVTLTADGAGTELHIRHERLTLPGAAERHADGWRGALARLTAMLDGDASPADVRDHPHRRTTMMRYPVAVLAYVVPTFALGFVWHLVLFDSYYEALAIYRPDVIIPFGFVSMLIQAVDLHLDLRAGLCSTAGDAARRECSPTARSAPSCPGASRRWRWRRRTRWRRSRATS